MLLTPNFPSEECWLNVQEPENSLEKYNFPCKVNSHFVNQSIYFWNINSYFSVLAACLKGQRTGKWLKNIVKAENPTMPAAPGLFE